MLRCLRISLSTKSNAASAGGSNPSIVLTALMLLFPMVTAVMMMARKILETMSKESTMAGAELCCPAAKKRGSGEIRPSGISKISGMLGIGTSFSTAVLFSSIKPRINVGRGGAGDKACFPRHSAFSSGYFLVTNRMLLLKEL